MKGLTSNEHVLIRIVRGRVHNRLDPVERGVGTEASAGERVQFGYWYETLRCAWWDVSGWRNNNFLVFLHDHTVSRQSSVSHSKHTFSEWRTVPAGSTYFVPNCESILLELDADAEV